MISVDGELIDSISAVFYHLHAGKIPASIPMPAELPDNEIRQLLTFVNCFLSEFAPLAEGMKEIAQGDVNTRPVFGRMSIVNAFKTLRANLRHPTWKTQQIAGGDSTQRLDFVGDLSTAFNYKYYLAYQMIEEQRSEREGQRVGEVRGGSVMDSAGFQPHPLTVVADGLFRPNGTFYCQPKTKPKELEEILRPLGVGKFSKIHCIGGQDSIHLGHMGVGSM